MKIANPRCSSATPYVVTAEEKFDATDPPDAVRPARREGELVGMSNWGCRPVRRGYRINGVNTPRIQNMEGIPEFGAVEMLGAAVFASLSCKRC